MIEDHYLGPSRCGICNDWPAMDTPKGKRCHICWCKDVADANPVPLPNAPERLMDLASIGVPGALEKLTSSGRPDLAELAFIEGFLTGRDYGVGKVGTFNAVSQFIEDRAGEAKHAWENSQIYKTR